MKNKFKKKKNTYVPFQFSYSYLDSTVGLGVSGCLMLLIPGFRTQGHNNKYWVGNISLFLFKLEVVPCVFEMSRGWFFLRSL